MLVVINCYWTLQIKIFLCIHFSQTPAICVFSCQLKTQIYSFILHVPTCYIIYLFRLREINEDASTQQQPRKRSNSLPIPKIEVSMYQSPELKKRESKDFMEVPEVKDVSYLTGNNHQRTVRMSF
jgi:hypothetical protein